MHITQENTDTFSIRVNDTTTMLGMRYFLMISLSVADDRTYATI